jgi:hypothetical protein
MKKIKVAALVTVGVIVGSLFTSTTAQAGSICNNGSYSSNSGRGTCSWNGGVNRNFSSFSDPGSSSFNRNNGYGSSRNNGYGSSRNNGFSNDPYGFNKPYNDFSNISPLGTQKTRSRW